MHAAAEPDDDPDPLMESVGVTGTDRDSMLRRIVAGAIALHAVAAWLGRELGMLVTQDDARYILLARSIRSLGYHDLYSTDLPLHTLYPPGYPILLAPWGAVFGEGFTTYTVLSVLLSAAALWLVFLALRKLRSVEFATLCVVALSMNSLLVLRAGSVRSEVPFLFFIALFAWAVAGERVSDRSLVIAAVAAIAAALTRSLGAALPLALIVHLLLKRRYRATVGFTVAALLTVGLWHVWTLTADTSSAVPGYLQSAMGPPQETRSFLQVLFVRVTRNVSRYLTSLPGQLFPTVPGTVIDNAAALAIWAAGLTVGAWHLRRRWRAAVLVLVISAGVLVIWPYNRSRFVEPYLPLIVPCVVLGVGLLAGRWRPSLGRPAAITVAAVIAITGAAESVTAIVARQGCAEFSLSDPPACLPEDTRSFLQAVDYVDRRTPDDAVFVSAKPEPLFYYSGRRSISYPLVRDAPPSTDFATLFKNLGVDYVLLGSVHSTEPSTLVDRIGSACDELAVEAYFPPRTYLFRVVAEPGAGPDPGTEADACTALEQYRESVADTDLGRRLDLLDQ